MNHTSTTTSGAVDTRRVVGRRNLRFTSLDEVLADVDRLVQAERSGRLRRLGNWSLGQTLGHLATWAEYAYTPAPLRPPWFVKVVLRIMKRQYLYRSMRAGAEIPGVAGGTLGTEPMSLEDALPRFRRAFERLKEEAPTAPSPAFGPLTHEEGMALNMRHAELHLSFLVPEA